MVPLQASILDPLAATAERIVRQHGDDDADVFAARGTDGDLRNLSHDAFR